MKKINEMMISAYLKGMSKLNAFKDNESGEVIWWLSYLSSSL
jgi:hypothetical protein